MRRLNNKYYKLSSQKCAFSIYETLGLTFIFVASSVISNFILKNIILVPSNTIVKYIDKNDNPYVFNEKIKTKVDDILFLCNNETIKKICEYKTIVKLPNMPNYNYILLHGSPGSGKTHLCSYFAEKLNKKLAVVNLSEIKSQWVGSESQSLNTCLNYIDKHNTNDIIIFDEIDTIVTKRKYTHLAEKDASNTINVMLTWLNGVNTINNNKIIFFTTNHISELCPSFLDRMTHKLYLPTISKTEMKIYWKLHMEHFNNDQINEISQLNVPSYRVADNLLKCTIVSTIKNNKCIQEITVNDIITEYNIMYPIINLCNYTI
jgi:SpoVK/Ycf46/Vps4 family AAA+-type ATPase